MSMQPRRLGKYELREQLGYGGMAEVWKAFDTQLQRYVAIKILHAKLRDDPTFTSRFQREAQLVASLHHPNIVQVHDFQVAPQSDTAEGNSSYIAYMVMDYVEGQTLADYIRNTSSQGHIPPPADIVRLFSSICTAVDYAHQRGMIHRDIKPANILLDARNTRYNPMGEPILTDFGVARMMSASSNTLSGFQIGTPLYISPEQARGYPGNERSDFYSLGVILYEMVTGVTPFRGDNSFDLFSQHATASLVSPAAINPHIPPALTLVIMRSLAKNPADRFPSASSMAIALAESLHLPIPENLNPPAYPADSISGPTYISSLSYSQPHPAVQSPAAMPQATSSSPQMPSTTPTSGPQPTPALTPSLHYSASSPTYPAPATSSTGASASTVLGATPPAQSAPAGPSVQPPQLIAPAKRARGPRLYAWLALLLVAILLLAGFSGYWFLLRPAALSSLTGQAGFYSSGQLAENTTQGIADQIKIVLNNVPMPQSGKSYHAWLLGDTTPIVAKGDQSGPPPIHVPMLLTAALPVQNGSINYTFTGDGHHDNLISVGSRLLITEEDVNATTPSTDRSTWRYYGELPQELIPQDPNQLNATIHIRHLFYNEANTNALGLPGGLDFWLFRNTEKLFEWSLSARDDWNSGGTTTDIGTIRSQCIRILDYLDGISNVHIDLQNLPDSQRIIVDPTFGKVALLTVDAQYQNNHLDTDPIGYVPHMQYHVLQVYQAPDATPAMRATAKSIVDALDNIDGWLNTERTDAKQLIGLSDNDLSSPAGRDLLDNLVENATYAYTGKSNPITASVTPGVLQIHNDVLQLATFPLTNNLPDKIVI